MNESLGWKNVERVEFYHPDSYLVTGKFFIGENFLELVENSIFASMNGFSRKSDLKFRVGEKNYSVVHDRKVADRYGDGGERQHYCELFLDDMALLSSVKLSTWDTYSDDSEDHNLCEKKNTFLLVNHGLSSEIFWKIQRGDLI